MSNLSERIANDTRMPFEIRKAFSNAPDPEGWAYNWIMLWRECAARAIMDALGITGHGEHERHNAVLIEAQRWFKHSPHDVQEVFENAQVPLEICRESIFQNFSLTRRAPRITRVGHKGKKK